jgi:hypothetical protein
MFWGKKHITERPIQAKQQLLIFMKGTLNEKPILTIGVYFWDNVTQDHFPGVFASIGQVIQPYLADQEDMDMMPLKGGIYETVKAIEDSRIYSI